MAKTTLILKSDGQTIYLVQAALSEALEKIKSLNKELTSVLSCSIEGIDAFIITQNYENQIDNLINVFEMFENMPVEDIAKCMLLAVHEKIPLLETPKHIHLIQAAQRINTENSLRSKAKHFMQHMEWQGFEFLAA